MNPSRDFKERTYRNEIRSGSLAAYRVAVRESDLYIRSDTDLSPLVKETLIRYRRFIEAYIAGHPAFLTSLVPLDADPFAPPIVREMLDASRLAGVGPMAAVAGAIAQFVGMDINVHSDNVIVENGGDIFIKTVEDVRIGVFAGTSPLNGKITLLVKSRKTPIGVCTSSATVGPSLSFGRADAVCIVSRSAVLADAVATAVGNTVKKKEDIEQALNYGAGIAGVLGVLIIMEDRLGAIGAIELVE